ncbi:hypothetical protein BGX23_010647 [Mortierella sp. AD031]|nr:hypothetical protein BGX23_010647 [Mortierella sp. AD031]
MKNTMVSLTIVLGLLSASNNAVPIARRNDESASCPGTLRGPSGNAYFAFSTNLNIRTAREACASCYGGSLANVGATDLQLLASNLESASWIKVWNGDNYASSCLAIQPTAGAPSEEHTNGAQRIEEQAEATIITLAVPYIQKGAIAPAEQVAIQEPIAAEAAVPSLEPTKVVVEGEVVAPDATYPIDSTKTCPRKSDADGSYQSDSNCSETDEVAATVVIEEPTKIVAEINVAIPNVTGPNAPEVTCPRNPNGSHQTDGTCVEAKEEAAAVVIEEPTKVFADVNAAVPVPDATSPNAPKVTCPKKPDGTYQTDGSFIAPKEEEAAVVVVEEPTKVIIDGETIVADATHPIEPVATCPRRPEGASQTENSWSSLLSLRLLLLLPKSSFLSPRLLPLLAIAAPAPEIIAAPVPVPAAVEVIDPLTIEKEKVQAAFELDAAACSSQLALGEQDPLVN